MIETKVGVEAEFLLFNGGAQPVMPPTDWPRDGFPLLAEIQAKPGQNLPEVIGNWERARLETVAKVKALEESHTMHLYDAFRIPLELYREVNRATNWATKQESLGQIKNIYGINIEDFSDQVVQRGKIIGVLISCGLHIHFSCEDKVERLLPRDRYTRVNIAAVSGMQFYIKEDSLPAESITVRASKLNKPTINWMVKELDDTFFSRFVPKARITKFRQPGFYELKPYGFEYRSLPCNDETIAALPEIVEKAFTLLDEAK